MTHPLHRAGLWGGVATSVLVLAAGLIQPPALPAAPLAVRHPLQQEAWVRLLVPLETGHELEHLLPIAPTAQLVEIDGRSYVLLGSFADALVAYRLGRTFQARLRLPFELGYDDGHPQRDGSWLAHHRQSTLPPLQIPPPPPLVPEPPQQESAPSPVPLEPLPGHAHQLGGPLVLASAASNLSAAGVSPAPPDSESSGLKPVAINPVAVVPVAVAPPQRLAVNPGLHYLLVKLQSAEQLLALRQHAPIAEMGERNGELLARVGVFTPTPVGRRLLNQQARRLAAMGYDMEVSHVKT